MGIAGLWMPAIAQSDFGALLDGIAECMGGASGGITYGKPASRGGATGIGTTGASASGGGSVRGTLDYLWSVYETPIPDITDAGDDWGDRGHTGRSRKETVRIYTGPIPPIGRTVTPCAGRITSRFGYRPQYGRMHHGTDIAVNIGDTIRAAVDGIVTRVASDPRGYGLFICLQHGNGLQTRYGHLSGFLVSQGMRVSAGQPIGLGGNTGNSTGPHLHFETRINGQPVDLSYMFNLGDDSSKSGYMAQGDNYTDKRVQASEGGRSTYVVRYGDTIASVAAKFGIPVLKLCNLNMLSMTDALEVGRMIKLR